jgi:K+ transporter
MTAASQKPTAKLMLGATGVVFGDIGTSPLYAFRESFIGHHRLPLDQFHVLGVLSMLIWALILVVTVKYVFVTMRADNRGEGGSFALLALIERVARTSPALPWVAGAALLATALFYGDAVITPAISILSAVEGMSLLDPAFGEWVIPLTLVIIVALFAIQRYGTGTVGTFFGPVMTLWFATIAVPGGIQVAANPGVLAAVNPVYAAQFFLADPVRAFFTLGTVVLAVTGAEALYADMGHFGRGAIARAWLCLALPALLLCYAGQSALVLGDPSAIRSPFYLMAPAWLLVLLLERARRGVRAGGDADHGADHIDDRLRRVPYMALEPAMGCPDLCHPAAARSRPVRGVGDQIPRRRLVAGNDRRGARAHLRHVAARPRTAHRKLTEETMPLEAFLKSTTKVQRIPANAIYLTSSSEGVPPALLHNLKYNLVLLERVFIVTIETALTPQVDEGRRLDVRPLGEGFTRVIVRYGFAESPDVPHALAPVMEREKCNPMAAAYFLSRQTLVPSRRPGMALWREHLFAAMVRNAETPMTFFKLPVNRVVELGSQVEI